MGLHWAAGHQEDPIRAWRRLGRQTGLRCKLHGFVMVCSRGGRLGARSYHSHGGSGGQQPDGSLLPVQRGHRTHSDHKGDNVPRTIWSNLVQAPSIVDQ
eukprot:614491-Lingulodinium_polyedra.AAC.1